MPTRPAGGPLLDDLRAIIPPGEAPPGSPIPVDAAGERSGADGYLVACFGDPGLDAAREVTAGPVVGLAEAAMHAAMLLGCG